MKKWICLMVCMCLLGIACAEEKQMDTPALKNPQERYEQYVEETDGSETAVFIILDAMNDEAAIIEEYGAFISKTEMVNAEGQVYTEAETILQESMFGHMIITSAEMYGISAEMYDVGTRRYMVDNGQYTGVTDGYTQEDFDWYWESFCFPYGSLNTLNGVRQDENGYVYYLIKSDENMSFEFVTGDSGKIVQLRIYERNSEGELILTMLVTPEHGPARAVPMDVKKAIAADRAR